MSWLVRTFTTDTGRKPVDEWVAGLDQEAQAAVNAVVNLLKEYGVELGGKHVDFLGDGVWELRARDSTGKAGRSASYTASPKDAEDPTARARDCETSAGSLAEQTNWQRTLRWTIGIAYTRS